jgi:hypothetical protein
VVSEYAVVKRLVINVFLDKFREIECHTIVVLVLDEALVIVTEKPGYGLIEAKPDLVHPPVVQDLVGQGSIGDVHRSLVFQDVVQIFNELLLQVLRQLYGVHKRIFVVPRKHTIVVLRELKKARLVPIFLVQR